MRRSRARRRKRTKADPGSVRMPRSDVCAGAVVCNITFSASTKTLTHRHAPHTARRRRDLMRGRTLLSAPRRCNIFMLTLSRCARARLTVRLFGSAHRPKRGEPEPAPRAIGRPCASGRNHHHHTRTSFSKMLHASIDVAPRKHSLYNIMACIRPSHTRIYRDHGSKSQTDGHHSRAVPSFSPIRSTS